MNQSRALTEIGFHYGKRVLFCMILAEGQDKKIHPMQVL